MKDIILYICAVGAIVIDLLMFMMFIKEFPNILEEKFNNLKNIQKGDEVEDEEKK